MEPASDPGSNPGGGRPNEVWPAPASFSKIRDFRICWPAPQVSLSLLDNSTSDIKLQFETAYLKLFNVSNEITVASAFDSPPSILSGSSENPLFIFLTIF